MVACLGNLPEKRLPHRNTCNIPHSTTRGQDNRVRVPDSTGRHARLELSARRLVATGRNDPHAICRRPANLLGRHRERHANEGGTERLCVHFAAGALQVIVLPSLCIRGLRKRESLSEGRQNG